MPATQESSDSRSVRIVQTLKQFHQFVPAQARNTAIHVLQGTIVTPLPDPHHEDNGLLQLQFAGGRTEVVMGPAYLRLQLIEHCRLEVDGPNGQGPVSELVQHWTASLGQALTQD
jgi:hypothetical protein